MRKKVKFEAKNTAMFARTQLLRLTSIPTTNGSPEHLSMMHACDTPSWLYTQKCPVADLSDAFTIIALIECRK
jgi:hypothetical protein